MGKSSTSLSKLLHTILLLPAEIELSNYVRRVKLQRNPKSPEVMKKLKPALERLNALCTLHLDKRRIEFASAWYHKLCTLIYIAENHVIYYLRTYFGSQFEPTPSLLFDLPRITTSSTMKFPTKEWNPVRFYRPARVADNTNPDRLTGLKIPNAPESSQRIVVVGWAERMRFWRCANSASRSDE